MKTYFFAIMLALVFGFGTAGPESQRDTKRALEPTSFWTAIANDQNAESWRRGLALYLLFERHIKKDISLGELSRILDKPLWFTKEDVFDIPAVAGWIPLKPTAGDTMVWIRVFSNKDVKKDREEVIAIYLNVSGEIDIQSLISLLKNQEKSKYDNRKVKAVAISPTWEEYVKRIAR